MLLQDSARFVLASGVGDITQFMRMETSVHYVMKRPSVKKGGSLLSPMGGGVPKRFDAPQNIPSIYVVKKAHPHLQKPY